MKERFSIKVISSSCGVLPHTLRVWEQRYNMFNPERSEGGQRLYSIDDLNKAKLLSRLIDQGHSISNLATYSNSELEKMTGLLQQDSEQKEDYDHQVSTKRLLKYLSDYKIDAVAEELQHLRLSVGVKDFVFKIALPTMREIGLLVAKGKYSVTQEHIISTIIRDQLSQIYLPNLGDKHNEIALATPDGNLHELSIILADILCRANRVSTRCLGAAHPANCLAEAMNALKCPTLVLGAVSSDKWDYETQIIPYLESMDKILKVKINIIIGGGKELDFPKFKNIKKISAIQSFEEFDEYLSKVNFTF